MTQKKKANRRASVLRRDQLQVKQKARLPLKKMKVSPPPEVPPAPPKKSKQQK